jgi:hypothetical protein
VYFDSNVTVGLFRIVEVSSLSFNTAYRWVTTQFCFMNGTWMWCRTVGVVSDRHERRTALTAGGGLSKTGMGYAWIRIASNDTEWFWIGSHIAVQSCVA